MILLKNANGMPKNVNDMLDKIYVLHSSLLTWKYKKLKISMSGAASLVKIKEKYIGKHKWHVKNINGIL